MKLIGPEEEDILVPAIRPIIPNIPDPAVVVIPIDIMTIAHTSL